MANLYGKKAKAPQMMPVDGRAVMIDDSISLAANIDDGDVLNFRLPAGLRLGILAIRSDDIDTGAGAVFSVGYRAADPASSLAANATYFAAAGQTLSQSGGTLNCSFEPIKFEEDVYVTITYAVNPATFAAGDVCMIAVGAAEGAK